MNLTAEQVKNLNILADFMDKVHLGPDDEFSMSSYWSRHRCGTRGCALGWACLVPEFKEAGLTPEWLGFGNMHVATPEIAEKFFGPIYDDLFSSSLSETVSTPQQWAPHCRAFLKSNGYATADPFKTFMDRVMVPVDTSEISVAVKSK